MPPKHQPTDNERETDGAAPRQLTPTEGEELAAEYQLLGLTNLQVRLPPDFQTARLGLTDAQGRQAPEALRETIREASHRIGGAFAEQVDEFIAETEAHRGIRPLPIRTPEQAAELLVEYMADRQARDRAEGDRDE